MIKEKFEFWSEMSLKLGACFARLPLSPNAYSWLSVVPAIFGFVALLEGFIWTGVVLFTLSSILDLLDGAVARHLQKVSASGAFLDGSLDRLVDFLLIFSYLWLPIEVPGLSLGAWVGMCLYFAILPSFIVAYANHRQAVDDPHETVIWRILHRGEMYVLMLLVPVMAIYNSVWAGYVLIALVVLSIITSLQAFFLTLYYAKKLGR